ncbi:MAG TPA: ABC transporter permease [Candidatus Dormibacteraeota bacterium]
MLGRLAAGATGVVAPLLALELLARSEVLPQREVPPPSVWLQVLVQQLPAPAFWADVGSTLEGWAIGLTLAALIAVPAGILIGSSRLGYQMLRAPIEFLRPIPSVALIPLAVLVFGTRLQNKVFLVTFACLWPLLFQAIYGVQDVDPVAVDTARAFGFGRPARLLRVVLPSAAPYLATGLRIASSVALILAVTSELVVGVPGLGRSINVAASSGDYALMYALIAVAGLLGLALNAAFGRLEGWLLRWHPAQRAEAPA